MIRLLVTDGAASRFARRVRDSPAARSFGLIFAERDQEDDILACAPEADAILVYQAPISASVIDAAGALRLIQKHGVNLSGIDVAAATRRGVRVATASLLRFVTVSEHALALMLACARKVVPGHQAVTGAVYRQNGPEPIVTSQHEYRSNWPAIQGVTELYGATAGIVGMGGIGMEITKRCRAFGMQLRYFQRTRHPEATEAQFGARYAAFDELLRESDYVILAVPHTPQTERLIGARELDLMKKSATLVNVGRGGLLDEDALAQALADGRIAMAGLDVYRREPLPAESPLLTAPNVVLLPHTGGGSYRSWEVDIPAVLRNIERFFAGEGAEGIVNG